MVNRKLIAGSVILGVLSTILVAAPATAATPVPNTIGGWTKTKFVSAAVARGVDPITAGAVWGNESLMNQIPVSTQMLSSAQPKKAEVTGLASTTNYSAWCQQNTYSFAGIQLDSLRVTSTWTGNSSSAITTYHSGISTTSAWGWQFSGLTYTDDYYSTAYENSKGAHDSVRWGGFHNSAVNTDETIKVRIHFTALGVHTCTSSVVQ